jgi:hypothetical protein
LQISATLQKAEWSFLKKLIIELPYDPMLPLLGIYPKEHESGYSRNTCAAMFIVAPFTIAMLWKQLRCPETEEWIKKMWCIYIYNEVLLSRKE